MGKADRHLSSLVTLFAPSSSLCGDYEAQMEESNWWTERQSLLSQDKTHISCSGGKGLDRLYLSLLVRMFLGMQDFPHILQLQRQYMFMVFVPEKKKESIKEITLNLPNRRKPC